MKKIEIKWLWQDIMDGNEMVTYGQGAEVALDGMPFLSLVPIVSREKTVSYEQEEVYAALFERLGVKVVGCHHGQNLPEPWKGKEFHIQWLTDSNDCEQCGGGWANGAIILSKGVKLIDMSPAASCYGGTHYTTEEVYQALFNHLGYEIIETPIDYE